MSDSLVTFLTRTAGNRPKMLRCATESIQAQDSDRWQHVVSRMETRASREHANGTIAEARERSINGRYVYVLDDDDMLVDPGFAEALEVLREPWVMVKAHLGSPGERHDGVWPVPWGEDWRPKFGSVSTLNLVVRADVFHEYKAAWAGGRGGDYRMAKAMWDAGLRPYWLDRLVARTQRISNGAAEPWWWGNSMPAAVTGGEA